MPPALVLVSVPLVHEVLDSGMPSSAALTPAAVAPLVAPQVCKVESSTLPSVMPSQSGLGLSLSLATVVLCGGCFKTSYTNMGMLPPVPPFVLITAPVLMENTTQNQLPVICYNL